jgi:eukaryotic-like serine/threonine-protein kinase
MTDARRSSVPAADRLFLEFQTALAGRYSIERELGRGGMGVVYLAREVRLDRPVALKLLPPVLAAQPGPRDRFLREARMAAKLSHPNIIPIFAVDEIGDFVFFAMAYVDGETLTQRVRRRGPLGSGDAARMLREVAWALAYAHDHGVIHRDVKPDNIMLESGTNRALVADFGIAAQVSGAAGLDGGEVVGTPEFMSPEQALGEHVDAKSDLYALGAVGYFALSGRLPFEGLKPTEVLAKQVTETARPLAEVADGTPRRLAQAIDRCLAKERSERPESAAALSEQMGLALEQRRELPVALRVFVKRGGRLGGTGGLIYLLSIPPAIGLVTALAPPELRFTAAMGTFLASITVVPFGMLVARARRFLASGFDPKDLGPAFRVELEQGREERVFEYGRTAGSYERVTRLLSAGGAAIAVVSGAIMAVTPWPLLFEMYGRLLPSVFGWSLFGSIGAGWLWLTRLNRRIDLDTRIFSWLWRGPVGRLLFRLARPFVSRKALPPPATHRATELALGMAAERLFEELPRETRQQLRDLPDVVSRLETDAKRMRERFDELNDALEGAGERGRLSGQIAGDIKARRDRIVTDLHAERELVQRRLKEAVAALETIRLNLLRLHAGTGTVHSLTTDLGLAREAAHEVELLLEGQREAEEAL